MTTHKSEWEEFNKEFPQHTMHVQLKNYIKNRIASALASQKKEMVEKLEGAKKPEKIIEDCENCGNEGYGKAWYGRGRETGDSWGDRYTPTGSVVFCKDCAKDFRIGKEWMGEEIWKTTSDDPQHAELRISRITKTVNVEHNQALDTAIALIQNNDTV